jgi:MoaA/NifB/PqqE/SkfB family radical SAM enzyme
MCFYWKETEESDIKAELSLQEYEKIAKSLTHLYYLSIGGGEPFLRKDLPHIVEVYFKKSRTRVVTVATNGSLPERVKEYIEYLTEKCPGLQLRIQVSIDSLHEKHDNLRGVKGLFDKVLQTCRYINDTKQAGASIMLSIGTVMTPANRDELKDIRSFLDENISYDDLSLIYPRGNARDSSFKNVSYGEYKKAKKYFESIHTMSGSFARIYQTVDREAKRGIESFLKEGPSGYPWTCVAGKRMITLTEKGVLTPCEMLYQLRPDLDSSIGNVRDFQYDVERMISTLKAKELRKFIEKTPCSCSYECAALCNVVFHVSQWPRVLKKVFLN